MSTFGEIIEPSSRATWEDWDDVDNGFHLPELQWQIPLEMPEEVEKIFVFEGKYLWDGVLTEAKKKIEEVNSVREVNLHLYKMPEVNNYICIIRDCDLMLSNDVVNLIKNLIAKAKIVVAVQIKPITEYITTKPIIQPCIIRKVTSTNTTNLMKVNHPKLEQPNIISGVAAGVFTLREHLSLSAIAVVVYVEHAQDYQIEDIERLMMDLDISKTGRIKANPVLNSNLYI